MVSSVALRLREHRALQLGSGLVIVGTGIAALVRADLGLGPWDVLHQGISERTGIPMGTVGILVGIPIVALWWPLRQRIGAGTIANLVVVGLTIDAVLAVTDDAEAMGLRWAVLLGGLALVALGSGLYLGVNLGAGPRDGLMTGLHRRFGWSIRAARTLIEVSALLTGMALGGKAGVGTLVFALSIGPLCQVTLRWFGFEQRPEVLEESLGLSAE